MGGIAVFLFITFIIFIPVAYAISTVRPAIANVPVKTSVSGIPVTNTTLLRIMAFMPLATILISVLGGPLFNMLHGTTAYVFDMVWVLVCLASCFAGAQCGRYLLRNRPVWSRLFFMVSVFIGSAYCFIGLILTLVMCGFNIH